VRGHEGVASRVDTLAAETSDLTLVVDLVVAEDCKVDLAVLVRNTLGGGVDLLLVLLATTTKAENKVEGGLLLDVVIRKSVTILKLLAGEDQTLLIRGDALLVLDLGLHSINAVGRIDLKGNSLASESLNENLHDYKK